jgi:hypothetical protein
MIDNIVGASEQASFLFRRHIVLGRTHVYRVFRTMRVQSIRW